MKLNTTIEVKEAPLTVKSSDLQVNIPLYNEHVQIVVDEHFENCPFNCNSESERFTFNVGQDDLIMLMHGKSPLHTFHKGAYEVFVSSDHSVIYFDHQRH